MWPQRLHPQVGAAEHGGIEHSRLQPMIAAADLFNRTQDILLPLPPPLPVPVQPAPLAPTSSCECAPLDAMRCGLVDNGCKTLAGATEQSHKCKYFNAEVAETTDGKPLVRERSEDGLCLTLVVLQSISFVLTSPTNRKLICAEIEHCFDARFQHSRSWSMYADVCTNEMIWKATGAKS